MKKTPTNLQVKDLSIRDHDLTIRYSWQYEDGSKDKGNREVKTTIEKLENCYNLIGWGYPMTFLSYWEIGSRRYQLLFLFLYLLDFQNGVIDQLTRAIAREVKNNPQFLTIAA